MFSDELMQQLRTDIVKSAVENLFIKYKQANATTNKRKARVAVNKRTVAETKPPPRSTSQPANSKGCKIALKRSPSPSPARRARRSISCEPSTSDGRGRRQEDLSPLPAKRRRGSTVCEPTTSQAQIKVESAAKRPKRSMSCEATISYAHTGNASPSPAKRAKRCMSCDPKTTHARRVNFDGQSPAGTKMESDQRVTQAEIDRAQRQFNIDLLKTYVVQKYPENKLFKSLPKGPICAQCFKPGDLVECYGPCKLSRHRNCASFPCQTCNVEKCFACSKTKLNERELLTCGFKSCNKKFHPSCLKVWPSQETSKPSVVCPMHTCHACNAENDCGYNVHSESQLVKCVSCPATCHKKSSCVPAGASLLTDSLVTIFI